MSTLSEYFPDPSDHHRVETAAQELLSLTTKRYHLLWKRMGNQDRNKNGTYEAPSGPAQLICGFCRKAVAAKGKTKKGSRFNDYIIRLDVGETHVRECSWNWMRAYLCRWNRGLEFPNHEFGKWLRAPSPVQRFIAAGLPKEIGSEEQIAIEAALVGISKVFTS